MFSCSFLPVRRVYLPVVMFLRKSEATGGFSFGIELNHHCSLVTDDPGIVSGLEHHSLRGNEFKRATVGKLATHMALEQEADVRMHAQGGVLRG